MQRNIALAIVLIMLAAFVATAPFGTIQLPRSSRRHARPSRAVLLVVIIAVCGATRFAITANDALPKLFLDQVHISPFGWQVSVAIGLLSTLALALLWFHGRSVLDLWLMVVLSAWLLEIAFFVVLTALRFSLAFYTSGIYAVVTASVVLLVLLSETTTLYMRLARSTVMQRREREGRVMSMGAMSASIAHEMSQPIGAMMASADAALLWLAKTPPDVDNVRRSIEHIAADGHRASELIASVRTFGKSDARKEPLAVNELIREVLAIERGELARDRIEVRTDLGEAISKVLFDRIQLQQVILNLIANAMEAMSSVTDRARVLHVTTQNHGQGQVLIIVTDTGTGIDRKALNQIFEPFFTTKSRGMGLGLWICRTIVENHNGRLTADSDPNRGSVFRVILPNQDAAGPAPQSPAPSAAAHMDS